MDYNLEGKKRTKSDVLSYLRQEIQQLEGYKRPQGQCIATGVSEIDQSLPDQSLPLAAVHDFICDTAEDIAPASGFLSALVSLIAQQTGVIVWIVKILNIFPPSLESFGLNPGRIVFVELPKTDEALWVMECALRCKSLAAVICEVSDTDLTATRRLQLAAEESGVTGFLLRVSPKKQSSSACVTRWTIKSLQSELSDGLPGVGFPRWNVTLVKVRNGRPGSWPVEWRGGRFNLLSKEAQAQSLPDHRATARQ